jgi:hypothetical protein
MNMTCNNWSGSEFGKAMFGHIDRTGLADNEFTRSWNSCRAVAVRPTLSRPAATDCFIASRSSGFCSRKRTHRTSLLRTARRVSLSPLEEGV